MDNGRMIDHVKFIVRIIQLNKLEFEEHLMAGFCYLDKDGVVMSWTMSFNKFVLTTL